MSLLSAAIGHRSRLNASYAAAQTNRLMLWYASLLSADRELRSSLRTLRARSRELVRDNPHAAAFLQLLRINVVGPDGIGFQSRITEGAREFRRQANTEIERGFREWGDPEYCTVDGRLSWSEAQELYITTMAMDGEVLLRHREAFDSPYGYALQFLDVDQLDEGWNRPAAPGVNEIRMGVEVNADNRPVAYHLFDGHPSDLNVRKKDRVRILADEIIHDFIPFRPNQTRGVPWMTPILLRLKMLDSYEENEIVASTVAAAKPILFEVDPEFADAYPEMEKPTEPLRMDVEPGMAMQLPVGLKPHQMNPTHPTSAFEPFQKAILRAIAVGEGVSYSSLTGDLTDVNFSSIRHGMLHERDGYRRLQRRTARHLCAPVFRRWIKWAGTTGAVRLPSADVARWSAPTWQPRGFPWIDPAADLQAAQLEVQLGINTRGRLAAERGLSFEDNLAELAEEEQLAREYGVTLGADPAVQETINTVNQPDMPGAKPGKGKPKDDGEEAEAHHHGNGNGHNRLRALDLAELP